MPARARRRAAEHARELLHPPRAIEPRQTVLPSAARGRADIILRAARSALLSDLRARCQADFDGTVPPSIGSNPGGGWVSGRVVEGGTENQTTFNFFNRSNPGIIKVCKIAGPGIPIGAEFDFVVQGTVADPAPVFAPGTLQNRRVRVLAGPDSINGGFCEFVRNDDGTLTQFVVGTNVYVREYDYIEGTGQTALNLTNGGSIRVGRIRMEQGAGSFAFPVDVAAAAAGAFPAYDPPSMATPGFRLGPIDNQAAPLTTPVADATFLARRGTREIEYVNFVFRPTALKVCKIAGAGVAVGTPYTFNIAIGNFPGFDNIISHGSVSSVTVQAGPASSGGFCTFANGPAQYPLIFTNPDVRSFPVGFPVTVTEVGGNVTAVTSPTGTVTNPVLGANGAGTLVLGFPGGFNEIVFTNGTTAPVSTGFTLSGRVMTPDGGGLRNAQVILVGADGSKFSVPTNSMGFYSFDSLSSQAYRATVASRRYKFEAKDIELNDSLSAVNFTGLE